MGRLEPITLEGRYVRLEPLTIGHAPHLAAAARGPRETFAFSPVPADEAEAARHVAGLLRLHADDKALPFATPDWSPAPFSVR